MADRLWLFQLGQNAARLVSVPRGVGDGDRLAVRARGVVDVELQLVELVVLASRVSDVIVLVRLEGAVFVGLRHLDATEHAGGSDAISLVERCEVALEIAEFERRAGVPIVGRHRRPCQVVID